MQTISEVIDAIGGTTKAAAALDVPMGTVAAWKHRDSIPSEYWPDVVRVAAEIGVVVSFAELAELAASREREQRAKRRQRRQEKREALP